MNERDLKQLMSDIAAHAYKSFGSKLDCIILYGSYARNEAEDGSDVDVMILVNMTQAELQKLRYQWNQFGTSLDLRYGVVTSMLLQDAETFYKWKDVLPFYQNVLKEGVRYVA